MRQYEPGRDGVNTNAFTHFAYDQLGRTITKWQRFSRVDADPLPPESSANFRRTNYVHNGLTTSIQVCQVASMSESCSGGQNADGSPQLSMTRTFDSAGKLVSTQDAHGGITRYWFDGAGNPLRITDVMGMSINATYNDFGHRLNVIDPDRGPWSFTYNGFGEVKTQIDARTEQTTLLLDKLGRVTRREWYETSRTSSAKLLFVETSAYENAPSNSLYGTVMNVTRFGGAFGTSDYEHWRREFTYDGLNRATQISTTMQAGVSPAVTLTTQTKFDRGFGRTKQMVYPASALDQGTVSIYQAYNRVGVLVKEGFAADYVPTDPEASPAIRRLNGVDGRGLLTSESYGVQASGVVDWHSNQLYDRSGWLLAQCVSQGGYTCATSLPNTNTNQPLDERYRYDIYGNLKTQYHNGLWLAGGAASNAGTGSVSYTYDALHRLTKAERTRPGAALETVDYAYDAIGSLLSKSDYGSSYSYDPIKKHRLNQLTLVPAVAGGQIDRVSQYDYDANGNTKQRVENGVETSLEYDIANLPRKIVKNTTTANFYEAPGGRYLQRMVAGGVTRDTYSLEKTYEREVVAGAISVERYYLTSGSLLTIKADGRKLNYLHTDRLGSPVTITEKALPSNGKLGDSPPTFVEHKGFDAFGKALDGQWGTSNLGMVNLQLGQAMNTGKRNQRGFTGHEHLDEFALIHMNGRAYDFNLGRFYGVDPIIQFPNNSQSLNPYSYLMNNPLAGTDPTGYACQAMTGTRICGFDTGVRGSVSLETSKAKGGEAIRRTLQSGGKLQTSVSKNSPKDNGAEPRQASTQASQTDGVKSGASGIGSASSSSRSNVVVHRVPEPTTLLIQNMLQPEDPRTKYSNSDLLFDDVASGIGEFQGIIDDQWRDTPAFSYVTVRTVSAFFLDGSKEAAESLRDGNYLGFAPALLRFGKLMRACCCFAPGTLIYTEHGMRPIEELRVGDRVWARDTTTGETTLKPILELFVTAAKPIYALTTVAADGSRETIEVTDNHPYYVIGQGWVDSGNLRPGMRIENFVRGALVVESLVATNVNAVTYNFSVGDFHTYFVGEQRALVHNCSRKCLLAQKLALESANSPFLENGQLTYAAVLNSKVIIQPGKLMNPNIPSGFGKYTTDTFQSSSGDFQVHYYMNDSTGEILYDLDYKVVFNKLSGSSRKPWEK